MLLLPNVYIFRCLSRRMVASVSIGQTVCSSLPQVMM